MQRVARWPAVHLPHMSMARSAATAQVHPVSSDSPDTQDAPGLMTEGPCTAVCS